MKKKNENKTVYEEMPILNLMINFNMKKDFLNLVKCKKSMISKDYYEEDLIQLARNYLSEQIKAYHQEFQSLENIKEIKYKPFPECEKELDQDNLGNSEDYNIAALQNYFEALFYMNEGLTLNENQNSQNQSAMTFNRFINIYEFIIMKINFFWSLKSFMALNRKNRFEEFKKFHSKVEKDRANSDRIKNEKIKFNDKKIEKLTKLTNTLKQENKKYREKEKKRKHKHKQFISVKNKFIEEKDSRSNMQSAMIKDLVYEIFILERNKKSLAERNKNLEKQNKSILDKNNELIRKNKLLKDHANDLSKQYDLSLSENHNGRLIIEKLNDECNRLLKNNTLLAKESVGLKQLIPQQEVKFQLCIQNIKEKNIRDMAGIKQKNKNILQENNTLKIQLNRLIFLNNLNIQQNNQKNINKTQSYFSRQHPSIGHRKNTTNIYSNHQNGGQFPVVYNPTPAASLFPQNQKISNLMCYQPNLLQNTPSPPNTSSLPNINANAPSPSQQNNTEFSQQVQSILNSLNMTG